MNIPRMAAVFLREVRDRQLSLKDIGILVKGFLRGTIYIVWYSYLKRTALIRFPFMVYAPVRIVGPGKVFINERCSVNYNIHEGLTIVTLSPDARVSIGKGCDLGGLTIRCRSAVKIDDEVMTSNCLIQDSVLTNGPSFTAHADRYQHFSDERPIYIGKNVWLSSMSTVLGGTAIGDDGVLSVGSSAMGQKTDDYQLLIGNPPRRKLSIANLLEFKGKS